MEEISGTQKFKNQMSKVSGLTECICLAQSHSGLLTIALSKAINKAEDRSQVHEPAMGLIILTQTLS